MWLARSNRADCRYQQKLHRAHACRAPGDSIKRLTQLVALSQPLTCHYAPNGTACTRINGMAGVDGVIGSACDVLRCNLQRNPEVLHIVRINTKEAK